MIRDYLKVTFRNLANQKFYTSLNIVGLSIGIASCLLILLYVYNELSYDTFHPKAERVYRVGLNGKIADQEIFTTSTCPPLASTVVEEFPEVENATRIFPYWGQQIIRYEQTAIFEEKVYFADSSFFDVFGFKLLEGNPATALTEPNTVVIPRDVAQKYFGTASGLGKTILIGAEKVPHKVTGILEKIPANTHLHFSMLRSMEGYPNSKDQMWLNNNLLTYLLLHKEASPASVEEKFVPMVVKYVGPEVQQFMGISLETFAEQGNKYGFFLQPLLDIHLHSQLNDELEPNGDITYVYIFAAIAFFMILLACINFMNLATARSANRAKEVGVRKTLGSLRSTLVWQFITESVVLSLIAALLALVMTILLLSPFNNIAGKEISVDLFRQPWFIMSFLGLMLTVGIIAGSYPAFYLSSFRPVEVLKGKLKAGMKSSGIRNVLVVFQFFVSITLIICTILVYEQLEYTRTKNLGFQKENVVVIEGMWPLSQGQQNTLKQALMDHSQVINASISNNVPPGVNNTTVFRKKGTEDDILISTYGIDYEHLPTMRIELLDGRNFSRDFPTDTTAILINEAAVKAFGFDQAVNETLEYFGGDNGRQEFKIVGVFKDFNYETLRNKIRPLVLFLTRRGGVMSVRVETDNMPSTLAMMEEAWKKHTPGEPFQYYFLDESYDALFRAEQRLGKIFSIFTGLAILVACLGLFGLAAFIAEQRTKEIGIRKVLGASVPGVVMLLSKEFTKLVVISFVIAAPVAYFIVDKWLEGFAFRIDIGLGIFIIAGLAALLIAWLTVSWQSIKAASVDPVHSLRNE